MCQVVKCFGWQLRFCFLSPFKAIFWPQLLVQIFVATLIFPFTLDLTRLMLFNKQNKIQAKQFFILSRFCQEIIIEHKQVHSYRPQVGEGSQLKGKWIQKKAENANTDWRLSSIEGCLLSSMKDCVQNCPDTILGEWGARSEMRYS